MPDDHKIQNTQVDQGTEDIQVQQVDQDAEYGKIHQVFQDFRQPGDTWYVKCTVINTKIITKGTSSAQAIVLNLNEIVLQAL